MSNQYTFHCPVKKAGTTVAHCEGVHSNGMQGKPHETEDKVCALAHICFMCPFRNAVRVGGPWSHPDKMPRAAEPQENPVKLPRPMVVYALAHTEPNDMDYRRVGLRGEDVGKYTDMFRDLQASVTGDTPLKQATRHNGNSGEETQRRMPGKRSKPKSAVDAMTDYDENEMANAVSELAKKERQKAPEKRSSKSEQSAPKKKPKRAESAAQSATDAANKPMSLAERAKLMKQRKQA